MNPYSNTPPILRVAALLTAALLAAPAPAAVTFYIQREGSPEDSGHELFIQSLPQYREEDFENPDLGVVNGPVPQLVYDDLELQLAGEWGGVFVPCLAYSSEFVMQGKVFNRALLPGFSLSVTPGEDQAIGAFGLWLFDDGRAYDAAYRLTVVETDGTISEVVLENTISRDAKGHELEGFSGVVSDVGIVSITIQAIDPLTGEPIPDVFETDHWIVTPFVAPPQPPPLVPTLDPDGPTQVCGDLNEDQIVDHADYLLILDALEYHSPNPHYLAAADADQDGVVSLDDFLAWRDCYRTFNGGVIPGIEGERPFKRMFPRRAELWPKHERLHKWLDGTLPPPRSIEPGKWKCEGPGLSPARGWKIGGTSRSAAGTGCKSVGKKR